MVDLLHKAHREIEAAKVLIAQIGDVLTDDDDLLRDTIEGETNLLDLIRALAVTAGEDEARVEGIAAYRKTLAEREARIKQRIDTVRTLIGTAMDIAGETKIDLDIATLSLGKKARAVVITEEADIPAEFWKPQPNKLDKKAVADALKADREVPGAALDNGGVSLTIRRR